MLTESELVKLRQRRAAKMIATGQDDRPYHTTINHCTCPDYVNRCYRLRIQCKHQMALAVSEDLKTRTAIQATTPAKATLSLEERKARAEAAILVLRGDENDSLV